jgi:hypothetical protein
MLFRLLAEIWNREILIEARWRLPRNEGECNIVYIEALREYSLPCSLLICKVTKTVNMKSRETFELV